MLCHLCYNSYSQIWGIKPGFCSQNLNSHAKSLLFFCIQKRKSDMFRGKKKKKKKRSVVLGGNEPKGFGVMWSYKIKKVDYESWSNVDVSHVLCSTQASPAQRVQSLSVLPGRLVCTRAILFPPPGPASFIDPGHGGLSKFGPISFGIETNCVAVGELSSIAPRIPPGRVLYLVVLSRRCALLLTRWAPPTRGTFYRSGLWWVTF